MQGLMVRGASASISRAALLTAAQLSSYDHAKVHLRPALGDGTLLHVAAAVISGFVATAAMLPRVPGTGASSVDCPAVARAAQPQVRTTSKGRQTGNKQLQL